MGATAQPLLLCQSQNNKNLGAGLEHVGRIDEIEAVAKLSFMSRMATFSTSSSIRIRNGIAASA